MGKVTLHISMSLDGFITEPNEGVGDPLGDDPGRLHDWMFDAKPETDAVVLDEIYASTGAILIGKRMFDVGFEPWGDPSPFGMPVLVVTHEERERLPMQGGTRCRSTSSPSCSAAASDSSRIPALSRFN